MYVDGLCAKQMVVGKLGADGKHVTVCDHRVTKWTNGQSHSGLSEGRYARLFAVWNTTYEIQ